MDIDVDFAHAGSWNADMPERTRWMRENAPVFWSEKTGAYIITRFEDVVHVSKNNELFCSGEGVLPGPLAPKIGMNDFAVTQTRPVSAMRWGKYKLLHFLEDDRSELYNLEADRGETIDLAKRAPAEAAKLKKELQAYLKEVGARMPEGMISRN